MVSEEQKPYHHGDLRQQLIDAAIALLQSEEVSQLSLRQVARQLGVSHNAPYRHFADKDALLAAVAEQGFQGLYEAMAAVTEVMPADPARQLQAIGMAYVEFALAHPAHYRLMFGAYRPTTCSPEAELLQAAGQAYGVLLNSVIQGQQAGVIRGDDPNQVALSAWSLVHGLAMLWMDGQLPMPGQSVTQIAECVTRFLLQGLLADQRTATSGGNR